MASPGHRAVMLGADYTHVGIAAVSAEHGQIAFALELGQRATQSAAE